MALQVIWPLDVAVTTLRVIWLCRHNATLSIGSHYATKVAVKKPGCHFLLLLFEVSDHEWENNNK